MPGERIALLPMVNASDSARAEEAARSIVESALYAHGVKSLVVVSRSQAGDLPSLDDRAAVEAAIARARKDGLSVGVTGSVNEWRYRPVDGRPAVGLSLSIVELSGRRVLWTASGACPGAIGSTVSGTAQILVEELLKELAVD